eukprot:TRINITY_DN990_c0_g1_i2.p1 TRINITY_DN990_c0_g1~~TRINITY_DN990_c0_g1_i2.p1  ORF type:complete len:202 (+),score=73.49 TRINITY_DN990_c0_g1_i2:80-685(+)
MAKASKMLVVVAVALTVCLFRQRSFVPPPAGRGMSSSATAGAVAMLGAAPTYADKIDEAAKKLSVESYDFLKAIDWNAKTWGVLPKTSPPEVLEALKPVFAWGVAVDSTALKRGVNAHIKAISSADEKGVISLEDYININKAIGHMVASVPAWKTLDVYTAFGPSFPKEAQEYLASQYGSDAEKAYKAFLEFKDVVKASQL